MYKIIFVSGLILFATHNSTVQKDSTAKANQILQIEQALMDALPGDIILWSRYLDDKWYIITEDGTGFFKKKFLEGFSPFPNGFLGHINVIKPVFTFYDKITVIHYVADEYEQVYGQKLHTTYAAANTYYQTDTSWKMIGSQIFEISQLPPAITVSNEILKTYTGTYSLIDTVTCMITFENGKLFIQKKGRSKEALSAETNNIFFRDSDTRGRKIFTKNFNGEMTMLERRNGNDLVWKKIK